MTPLEKARKFFELPHHYTETKVNIYLASLQKECKRKKKKEKEALVICSLTTFSE